MSRYFDYNATAPMRAEVVEAMTAAFRDGLGNPSSLHAHGRRARQAIDEARSSVAKLACAEPREIVFTSGATESNNLALRGFAARHPDATIVTTTIEHASVLATCEALERNGTTVVRVTVDGEARPDLARLRDACGRGRCLLSIGAANGETGHVTDVDAVLASIASETLVHADAAQAAGRVPLARWSRADLLSLSAHKIGGPTGVGALTVRGGVSDALRVLAPQLTGGPQEDGLRAGTENVAGIVGMGAAADVVARELAGESERLRCLRERLWGGLTGRVDDLIRLTPSDGLPNTLTVALADVDADVVVAALDLEGFSVSTGSACAAGSPEPSHVVAALGVDARYRKGVVRASMGHDVGENDVDALVAAFARVVGKARMAA